MNLDCPNAFRPFYDEKAIFSGDRREEGAATSRALSLGVPCCVLGGEPVAASTGSGAPVIEYAYTVKIRRADWPDHKPPQRGDMLTIDGRPVMRCLACLPDGNDWSLECHTKGELSS
jgi:hypothetical protein